MSPPSNHQSGLLADEPTTVPAPGDEDVVEGEEEEVEEEGDWAGGGVAEEAGWAGRLPKMASKSRFGGCVAPCSRGAGAGPSIRVPLAPPFFTCSHATPRHTHTDRQTDRQSDRHKHTCDHTRECSTIIGTPPVLAPPWAGSEEYQHRQPPGDCGCAVYPRSIHLRNFPCRPAGRGCRRLRQKALFHSNPSACHARVSVCACVHTWAPYTCACT